MPARRSAPPAPAAPAPPSASGPAPPPPLDDVDRRLLTELADDGRVSVNELASRAHVSRATAYSRFDRLRELGVIRGFSADIDHEAAGLALSALILIGAEQGQWRPLIDRLPLLPGVEWVALTSGEFDFVMLVRMHDTGTLRDILLEQLHSMREIRTTETIFILDEVRRPLDLVALAR